MRRVLAIADDLTGALEVGARFAACGMPSVVTTASRDSYDDPVVVIDTETRHASPAEAESMVEARAAGWSSLIYKKTDSTLRGNIGPELRALHRLYGGPIAYVPAYPEMGRTVVDGAVFIDGVPVAQTSFAHDSLNPVHNGNVRALLDPSCDCVVFDGETQDDVTRAARTILSSDVYRVVAGPGAIAGALAGALGTPTNVVWPSVRHCLVVNGSRHQASLAQVKYAFESCPVISMWRLLGPESTVNADPLQVALNTGEEVCNALSNSRFDGVLVIGGDTAFGVLKSLGLPALRPVGEILPGVPLSRIEGRSEILITKAGGFGAPDLLGRLRSILSE